MLRSRTRDALGMQIFITLFLVIILLIIAIPVWRVIVTAFTPLDVYTKQGVPFFLPFDKWTTHAFEQLLTHSQFPRAMVNSFTITLLGTAISMLLTVPLAYVLSNHRLPGRGFIVILVLFTYLFNPGLIPVYLLITKMGLINNYLAIILPPAVNVTNTLIMMRFFEGLPDELKEASRLDGATELQTLWHVILPLSKPILLTIGLFYAVFYWNEFFTPLLYLTDSKLMPLPVLLRNILISAGFNEYVDYNAFSTSTIESLRSAGVLLTMIPMVLVYPWIQRYFTKGNLLGSVKE
ncbi:MAG: carbohydrate ABC transporter permease [Anaerolineales bacterium]